MNTKNTDSQIQNQKQTSQTEAQESAHKLPTQKEVDASVNGSQAPVVADEELARDDESMEEDELDSDEAITSSGAMDVESASQQGFHSDAATQHRSVNSQTDTRENLGRRDSHEDLLRDAKK